MVAVVTASAQLFMQSIVYAEQLREIHPDLLKRLADSNVSAAIGSLPAAARALPAGYLLLLLPAGCRAP